MNRRRRCPSPLSLCVGVAFATVVIAGCASESATGDVEESVNGAWHGDCDSSDQAGDLVGKANRGQMFDAQLTWRQTNDQGQGIAVACDLSSHRVTSQGMSNVTLHCGGTQESRGYARVGARWGTSRGSEPCTRDFCAAIYVQDASGARQEVARDIYLKDRFFCGQSGDRIDERLDVDACTYSDVVRALKRGDADNSGANQSNLKFINGHLAGYDAKRLTLKYKMYPCGAGTGAGGGGSAPPPPSPPPPPSNGGGGGGGCDDKATPEGYSCAQQKGWGKCDESWMTSGGFCRKTCGHCGGCDDKRTPEGYSCAQQKGWGKCDEPWMTSGGFCRRTCGRCN